MKASEALTAVMKEKGIRMADMARMADTTLQAMYNRMHQKNLSVGMLSGMLKYCGYKVVIVPASKRLKEDEYEVE